MPERKPNILLFMSDEHNVNVTGCYGNGVARTPYLDALAAAGVTFDCAYTNSPLCVPARLAFTAGKYTSRVGAWSNNCRLGSDDMPGIARAMTAAGYDSLLCGKMHYDAARRYGFTEVGGDFNRYVKRGRGQRRKADDQRIDTDSRDRRFADFRTGRTSGILRHDRRVTRGAREFLAGRKRADPPFFLLVGHLAPHFPLTVPKKYWRPYRGNVPEPILPQGHVDNQPLNYHHLRRGFGIVETDPALVRKGRELYYGLTEWLDVEIGKVLRTLEDSGLADDTIVIYTTDHGENMGEHGLWWKNCMFDSAARIPLIVSAPKRWAGGQRRPQVCSLADLVWTVAELGGARCEDDWDGASLCGLMDDPSATWRNIAVSEYYAHNIASGFAMLRKGPCKYVYHTPADDEHPAQRELYDMAADPGEFTNLAADPAQQKRVESLHAALVKELGEHPDESEQRCRALYAKGYDRD